MRPFLAQAALAVALTATAAILYATGRAGHTDLGGGGGVRRVTAGANVTITGTASNPIINASTSASGGSAGLPLPDGSTTYATPAQVNSTMTAALTAVNTTYAVIQATANDVTAFKSAVRISTGNNYAAHAATGTRLAQLISAVSISTGNNYTAHAATGTRLEQLISAVQTTTGTNYTAHAATGTRLQQLIDATAASTAAHISTIGAFDEGSLLGGATNVDIIGSGASAALDAPTKTMRITVNAAGGGSSALEVRVPGVGASSPTVTVNFASGPFNFTANGSSPTITANYSSGTYLGPNPAASSIGAGTFGSGVILPVAQISGSNLPGGSSSYIQNSTAPTSATMAITSGTVSDKLTVGGVVQYSSYSATSTTYTVAGNRFVEPPGMPSAGQLKKYNADGVAYWAADNNSGGASGLPLAEGASNYIKNSTSPQVNDYMENGGHRTSTGVYTSSFSAIHELTGRGLVTPQSLDIDYSTRGAGYIIIVSTDPNSPTKFSAAKPDCTNGTCTEAVTFSSAVTFPQTSTVAVYNLKITSKTMTPGATFYLPLADGTNGQAMITDGLGHLSFSTILGGGGNTLPLPEGATNYIKNSTSPQVSGYMDNGGFRASTGTFVSSFTAKGLVTPDALKSTTTAVVPSTGMVVIISTTPGAESNFSYVRADCIDGICGSTLTFLDKIGVSTLVWTNPAGAPPRYPNWQAGPAEEILGSTFSSVNVSTLTLVIFSTRNLGSFVFYTSGTTTNADIMVTFNNDLYNSTRAYAIGRRQNVTLTSSSSARGLLVTGVSSGSSVSAELTMDINWASNIKQGEFRATRAPIPIFSTNTVTPSTYDGSWSYSDYTNNITTITISVITAAGVTGGSMKPPVYIRAKGMNIVPITPY